LRLDGCWEVERIQATEFYVKDLVFIFVTKDVSQAFSRQNSILRFGGKKDTKTFWIRRIRKPFRSKRYKNLLDENPKDMKTFGSIDTKTSENLLAPKIRNHTKYYSITP
jgi:hypothetical protein